MKSMIIQTRFRSISCSCSSSSINNIIGSGVTIVCIFFVVMSLQQPYFGNAFVTILNQKYYEHRRIQKQNERVLPVPMVQLSLSIKSSSKTMTALFVFGSDHSSDSNSNSNSDSNSNNKRPKNIDNNYDDNKYDGINPNYKHLEFYIDQDDNSENTNNNIGNGLSLYDTSRNEHFEKRRKRIEHERYIRNQFEQFGNKLWELRTEIDTLTNKLQSILLKNNGQLQSTALPSTTPTSTSTSISTNSNCTNNTSSSSFVGLLEQQQEQREQHEQQIRDQLRKAQSRDPELVYTIAVADMYRAREENNIKQYRICSNQAQVARSCLPQFQLNGLWVGKYSTNSSSGGTSTYELINISYVGDTLIAEKITGDTNVPRGEITFQVDLSPLRHISLQASSSSSSSSSATSTSFSSNNVDKNDDDNNNNNINNNNNNNNNNELQQQQQQQPPTTPPPSQPNTNTLYNHNHNILQPIQLTENAAKKWGIQKLPRYTGLGQVAEYGYKNHQWLPGQLILISDVYFSFVWLPIQEQIFFGRPSPELALKLIREQQEKEEKQKQQKQQQQQQQQKLNHHHHHHPQEKQDDYHQDHQQKQQKQLQKQSKQSKQPETVPTPITANDDINIFKEYAMRCMDKTNEIYNYHPQENGTGDHGTNDTDDPGTSGSGTFGCIWDSHDTDTCYFE